MKSLKYGKVIVENTRPSMAFDQNEPCVVFRAQDANAIAALEYYRGVCIGTGADSTAKVVEEAIREFEAWQSKNLGRIKRPD